MAIGLAIAWALGGCEMKGMIFFPERPITLTPADIGLPFEDIYFTAADGVTLNGWWVPADGASTTLLWFHGNAGNLSDRVDQLRLMHKELKANIFMIDYREYGRSRGRVSEEGTYHDAEGAMAHLRGRPDVDARRIVYYGQSLGAGVAVELARRQAPAGLMLEAPFLSVKEMAKSVMPLLPIGGLVSTKYDSISKIGKIRAPLLILHGDRDDIIPYEHGRRLFESANEPKRFYTIAGAHHNDTYAVGGAAYFQAMREFFETITPL